MKRVRANRGQGVRLREEILAAAEALLVEVGSEEALTLRAVAGRTGVSTPSVYLHFADKDQLIEAVCLRAWDELERRMREAARGIEDPFWALGQCGRVYVRFALDHPVQYRVLMMRQGSGSAAAACFGYIVEAVSACVASGALRGDPQTLALGLWSAAHGCASLVISQPSFPWPEDLDSFIDDTVWMAGFGTAIASRLPRHGVSTEVVAALDDFAERLTG
ncbi:TetR/AcrR family transcriptional regulator [Nonomuraea africana]|uniref:AcrR family transcriptional regulator n=1 Tax=Nonomuraea africana TaxID=46171 RepID=A0ABR9K645_9ACTN|nr:TetR/AcrR family transcriptional regulator [Nonomuraea africana]MBE1557276.1 AcrR family transcriptional regulator [Nonomuraea africana]